MKYKFIYLSLSVLLFCIIIFSLGAGAMQIPFKDVILLLWKSMSGSSISEEDELLKNILMEIRIPRIIFCTLIGAILGITGTAIQGIFRNPLAEPGLVGISSGASFFAALTIVFEASLIALIGNSLNLYLISISAFIGASLAVILVYRISIVEGKSNIATMILAGIAINALAGAATGLMSYMASEQQLRNITFWSLGSMAGATWESVNILIIFAVVSVVPLLFFGKALNLFALGESQAEMMGLNTKRLKILIIICSTLAVGVSVAFGGIIAFVGLLVPHTLRLIGSVDNRFLLPTSLLGGAIVLNLADLIARTIIQPLELPIGVITALIGAPVFLGILLREKRKL
ncbi:FecCD family ABC transporter permease [Sphingobacterium hotanense]|uniref:FecCD family ABC transporter permease n=1 Tax=Sphingobacterium hotanense TaxID=649196 RepID=UPI0021A8311E|nr:iron ABC transporter permease [Sphingobacterium hotanense]MCT1523051.1 iron ABC transporter permease [Sphingobacterium hotanense]